MLKKLGIVSVGVTAGLMAAAPFASATESHGSSSCNVTSAGNNIGVQRCNHIGHGNGVGNTFNGVELPAPPEPPVSFYDLPDFNGVASGMPTQIAIPGIPA